MNGHVLSADVYCNIFQTLSCVLQLRFPVRKRPGNREGFGTSAIKPMLQSSGNTARASLTSTCGELPPIRNPDGTPQHAATASEPLHKARSGVSTGASSETRGSAPMQSGAAAPDSVVAWVQQQQQQQANVPVPQQQQPANGLIWGRANTHQAPEAALVRVCLSHKCWHMLFFAKELCDWVPCGCLHAVLFAKLTCHCVSCWLPALCADCAQAPRPPPAAGGAQTA